MCGGINAMRPRINRLRCAPNMMSETIFNPAFPLTAAAECGARGKSCEIMWVSGDAWMAPCPESQTGNALSSLSFLDCGICPAFSFGADVENIFFCG